MLVIVIIFLASCFIYLVIQIIYLKQGAPFVRSSNDRIKSLLQLIPKEKTLIIADVGAGDGRLTIALAQKGIKVNGFEINPLLARRANKIISQKKLSKLAHVYTKNFWNVKLSHYNGVVVYGIKHIMPRLEKKLLRELKNGSFVISVYFKFPNLKTAKTIGEVHLYKITQTKA